LRVVQTEPGPMPTLTTSTPARISASVMSAVTTLPAMISTDGKRSRKRFTKSTKASV
jgi:hypothetical protein